MHFAWPVCQSVYSSVTLLCPLNISWTLWTILIKLNKLHPNVPLSETMRRTYDSAMQTQGRGHTSRSCDLPFKFHDRSISSTLWTISITHHSYVPLSELVCRTHDSAAQTRAQVCHGIYPWISCTLHISCSLWKIFIKLWSMFISVRGCADSWLSYPDSSLDHTSRSWDLSLNFLSAPYLPNPLNSFH